MSHDAAAGSATLSLSQLYLSFPSVKYVLLSNLRVGAQPQAAPELLPLRRAGNRALAGGRLVAVAETHADGAGDERRQAGQLRAVGSPGAGLHRHPTDGGHVVKSGAGGLDGLDVANVELDRLFRDHGVGCDRHLSLAPPVLVLRRCVPVGRLSLCGPRGGQLQPRRVPGALALGEVRRGVEAGPLAASLREAR
jgi:hypothetical protein